MVMLNSSASSIEREAISVGYLVHRRFYRHAGLHANEQQVERVGEHSLDGFLAALDEVRDEDNGQIEAEIGTAN